MITLSVICALCRQHFLVHRLEVTVLFQSSWYFTKMFVLVIYRSNSNKGHIRSKTRSDFFKTLFTLLEATVLFHEIVLIISQSSLNMGHVRSKTRVTRTNCLKTLLHTRKLNFEKGVYIGVSLLVGWSVYPSVTHFFSCYAISTYLHWLTSIFAHTFTMCRCAWHKFHMHQGQGHCC